MHDPHSNTPVSPARYEKWRVAGAMAAAAAEPRRNDFELWLVSSALAAVALSAYVATLCPGTPGGDAGEMLQLAIELGKQTPQRAR